MTQIPDSAKRKIEEEAQMFSDASTYYCDGHMECCGLRNRESIFYAFMSGYHLAKSETPVSGSDEDAIEAWGKELDANGETRLAGMAPGFRRGCAHVRSQLLPLLREVVDHLTVYSTGEDSHDLIARIEAALGGEAYACKIKIRD